MEMPLTPHKFDVVHVVIISCNKRTLNDIGVPSSDITFISSFLKIRNVVKIWKGPPGHSIVTSDSYFLRNAKKWSLWIGTAPNPQCLFKLEKRRHTSYGAVVNSVSGRVYVSFCSVWPSDIFSYHHAFPHHVSRCLFQLHLGAVSPQWTTVLFRVFRCSVRSETHCLLGCDAWRAMATCFKIGNQATVCICIFTLCAAPCPTDLGFWNTHEHQHSRHA
jgi:hypothetical protein